MKSVGGVVCLCLFLVFLFVFVFEFKLVDFPRLSWNEVTSSLVLSVNCQFSNHIDFPLALQIVNVLVSSIPGLGLLVLGGKESDDALTSPKESS